MKFLIISIVIGLGIFIYFMVTSGRTQVAPSPREIPKPIKIPTISEDIQLHQTVIDNGYPIYMMGFFFPEALYCKNVSDVAWMTWLDRIAENDACNAMRFFVGCSSWHAKYNPWIIFPFEVGEDNKYILPKKPDPEEMIRYMKPEYKTMLIGRLKDVVQRKIFASIDLWDNCQTHWRPNASWNQHWINGELNNIGTDDAPNTVYRYLKYPTEARTTKTGKYFEAWIRAIMRLVGRYLDDREKAFVGFNAGNEVEPNNKWHERVYQIIMEEFPCYRWKRLTSALPMNDVEPGLDKHFIYQAHHVSDHSDYSWVNGNICLDRFMISSDGVRIDGQKILVGKEQAKTLIRRVLHNGDFGIELMNGHRQNDIRLPNAENGWRYKLDCIDIETPKALVGVYREWRK